MKSDKEERHKSGKDCRAIKRNDVGTEKSEERQRGMRKKNGKERAAGEEKIELHLYYVIGPAGRTSRRTSAGRRRL